LCAFVHVCVCLPEKKPYFFSLLKVFVICKYMSSLHDDSKVFITNLCVCDCQIEQLKQELNRKESEMQALQTKLETLTNQNSDCKQHIEVLKESLSAKEQRASTLQTEVSVHMLRCTCTHTHTHMDTLAHTHRHKKISSYTNTHRYTHTDTNTHHDARSHSSLLKNTSKYTHSLRYMRLPESDDV